MSTSSLLFLSITVNPASLDFPSPASLEPSGDHTHELCADGNNVACLTLSIGYRSFTQLNSENLPSSPLASIHSSQYPSVRALPRLWRFLSLSIFSTAEPSTVATSAVSHMFL